MNQEQAIAKLKRMVDEYATLRRWLSAWWTMGIAYDDGQQWGGVDTAFGQYVVRRLKTIVDPAREDLRLTLNLIHKEVKALSARTKPQRVDFYCRPQSGRSEARVVTDLSNPVLARWIERQHVCETVREKDDIRYILGSVGERLTLIPSNAGNSVKAFDVGLSTVFPWEIIRDPSAITTNVRDDEDFCAHEKPRTVEWVKRNFGIDLSEQATSNMSELLDYQGQVYAARDQSGMSAPITGKTKGVLIYEAYFKDTPDGVPEDYEKPWNCCLFAWRDPKGNSEYTPLFFGQNPFPTLPFFFFHYDKKIQSGWARGVPHVLMGGQDLYNIGLSWVARVMQAGAGKWVVQKGTVENLSDALSNRVDRPVVWQVPQGQINGNAPTRISPPQLPVAATDILQLAPSWMQQAINFEDIQRGISSKRGESGEAIQLKLDAASAPIEDIRRDDELTIQEMLYAALGTLTDPRVTNAAMIRRHLGDDVPMQSVLALLRSPIRRSVSAVCLLPSTLRPQTPSESRDEIKGLVMSQILDPLTAKWEMLVRGVVVDSSMEMARRKQTVENAVMRTGQSVPVSMDDNHDVHQRCIRDEVNTPEYLSLPPQVQELYAQHAAQHEEAKLTRMRGVAPPPSGPSGQPSPPATAAMVGAGAPAMPVGMV